MFDFKLSKPANKKIYEWLSEPICIGGDRFSKTPGFSISFTAFNTGSGFDIKINPVQSDRPEFMQALFQGFGYRAWCFYIYHGQKLLLSGEFKILSNYDIGIGKGYFKHVQESIEDNELTLKVCKAL